MREETFTKQNTRHLEVVIPVKNEEKNVNALVREIHHALTQEGITYKLVFIVDKSTDNTISILKRLQKTYHIDFYEKKGKPGKGFSLLEGLDYCTSEFVAFIDGDLQYPPSAMPAMLNRILESSDTAVVVANRVSYASTWLRKFGSRANALVFGKLLLGLNVDIQSGLKVFRRSIVKHINAKHVTAWTFDIPLLHAASQLGYKIEQVDIDFVNRRNGASNVGFIKTALAIANCAINTKLSNHALYDDDAIIYRKKRYVTHNKLPIHKTALYTLANIQKALLAVTVFFFVLGVVLDANKTLVVLVAILSTIYFLDVIFNVYVVLKSLHFPPELDFENKELAALDESTLPTYTILCPLYKESEVIKSFVDNISKLDWPKEKLEVLLLLEEDDEVTINAARKMKLPEYVKSVVVPHSNPKTKPKACNYGLKIAEGEFIVIYDAEDKPEPSQLKKAYLAFHNSKNDRLFCVQAKLNYYNPHDNLLTRLFTAEYSLWFDVMLPGLQSINTTIPLGGTSNHFRTENLKQFHGWDAFNVTEDAELGARIFKEGFTTAIINSTTLEEANSNLKNWIRQRSRWIKGYFQTYLVHMREPLSFVRKKGIHFLIFQLIIGLRISFILINPILWAATISYFVLYKYVGPAIESLYPSAVFYMAATSLVFGNFIYLFNYMIGSAKRGQWSVIKYVYLVPFYWVMTSIAAGMAFHQLIFKPHHWEKTHHGLNLKKNTKNKNRSFRLSGSISQSIDIKKLIAIGTGGASVLVICGVISNFVNYLYNAYLGRSLELGDFGLISLIGSFIFISSIPLSALTRAITFEAAFSFGKYKRPLREFWEKMRFKMLILSGIVTVLWLIGTPYITKFFQSDSILPFIIFTPIILVNSLAAVDIGYLSGSQKFTILGILLLVEALVRFIVTWVLVEAGFPQYIYVAVPASIIITYLVGYFYALKISPSRQEIFNTAQAVFPAKFFVSSFFARFAIVAYLSFDLILAKHYLTPEDAGRYALISLIGKMIYFVGTLFAQFIIPVLAKEEGEQSDNKHSFRIMFWTSTLSSLLVYIGVGVFGRFTAPILLGDKIIDIVNLLPIYGLGILCFSVSTCIVNYHQVKNRHSFSVVGFILALGPIVAFYIVHDTLANVIYILSILGIANLIILGFMHFFYNQIIVVVQNLADFMEIFIKLPEKRARNIDGLKILVFNWRDIKHVWAGGAEVYVHELSKRLVSKGHSVTLFCGNDNKNPRYEEIEGVQIVRRGGFYTVYFWAFVYYIAKFRGKYDVIIDSENGIPFFTPLYAKEPVLGLIHHVHQDVFRENLIKPLAAIACFMEGTLMPAAYKRVKMITVSPSSKDALEKLGLGRHTETEIINPGIDPEKFKVSEKTVYPTILYLGRLKKYKSIDVLVKAFPHILEEFPEAKLRIAGFGESIYDLQDLVKGLNIEKSVEFLGKVDEETKTQLLAESWVFAYPSSMEGWGIAVIEASASGTTVIAANVPGLRDSVSNPHTGFLVPHGDVKETSNKIKDVLKNTELRKELEKGGVEWSKNFTWDSSVKKLEKIIKEMYE